MGLSELALICLALLCAAPAAADSFSSDPAEWLEAHAVEPAPPPPPPPPPPPVAPPKPDYSDVELFCLALNVHYEAAAEPYEGQIAVAQVTLTRARLTGEDVCAVVYKPWQFSWTMQESVRPPTHGDLKRGYSIALAAQDAPDLTGGATHFHADYAHPYWADILEKTTTIGRHIFYREESWYNRTAK